MFVGFGLGGFLLIFSVFYEFLGFYDNNRIIFGGRLNLDDLLNAPIVIKCHIRYLMTDLYIIDGQLIDA